MSKHGMSAAQIRGYIGTLRGINAHLLELDEELWSEGLAHTHAMRSPLIEAMQAIELAGIRLDQTAREITDTPGRN